MSSFAGPLSITDTDIENHVPLQQLVAIDEKTLSPLTAGELTARVNLNSMPELYHNPMHELDYRVYEAIVTKTLVGSLIDTLVRYIMGTGFQPELELLNPDEDSQKNSETIENNQDIITALKSIDDQISTPPEGEHDVTFQMKVAAMITSCLTYNRSALIFQKESGRTIKVNGVLYPQIPTHLHFAHARDLGMIRISPETRRMTAVDWRHSQQMIGVKDMIYLWNPATAAKSHNSWYYGTSMLTPLISSAKVIRQLLAQSFPAMSTNAWAGLYLLVVKNDGADVKAKQKEYEELVDKLPAGKTSILLKDPEDTELHNIHFDPKISEFQKLLESLVKMCISVVGLPHSGYYDQASANRATLIGKIQLTLRTVIEPLREWISQVLESQWYMRNYRRIYPDRQDEFRVSVAWSDLHVSEWHDTIDSILRLDSRAPLKDSDFGDLVGLPAYPGMLEPGGEVTPGGYTMRSSKEDDSSSKPKAT